MPHTPASSRGIRAVAWIAGFLVCHGLVSLAFAKSVMADHNLTRSNDNFYAAPHLQVLVTGDSHSRNAVAARALGDRSLSIALGGNTVIKTYYRLQDLLDTGKPVDVVILTADDHVFQDQANDHYHPIALWGRHLPYLTLATEVNEPKEMVVNAFRTYAVPYVDELPIWLSWARGNRTHFRNEALEGRMDKVGPRQRIADSLDRYHKVFGDQASIDPLKRLYFDRTVADLHRRGITVVLVRYPVMKVHNKLLESTGIRDLAQSEINDIARDERVVLLDFHDLYEDNPGLFDDADHLNVVGRFKFSRMLADELRNRGLLSVED